MRNALCEHLGLALDATDEEIIATIQELMKQKEEIATVVEETATNSVAKNTLEALQQQVHSLQKQLGTMQSESLETAINRVVAEGISNGKIAPANKKHFIAMCKKNG